MAARAQAQARARIAARAGDDLGGEGELTLAALDARGASRELTDRQRLRRERARDEARDDTLTYPLVAVGAAAFSVAIAVLAAGRRRTA